MSASHTIKPERASAIFIFICFVKSLFPEKVSEFPVVYECPAEVRRVDEPPLLALARDFRQTAVNPAHSVPAEVGFKHYGYVV